MSRKISFKKRDDDYDAGPCFEVGPDVQLKDIPTTGEEYLLKVITERQNTAKISECKVDYSKFAKKQKCFVKEVVPAKAPDRLKPTKEWQTIQVADFSEIRMYISRMLANKHLWPSGFKKTNAGHFTPEDWQNFFNVEEPTLSCVLGLHNDRASYDIGLRQLFEKLKVITLGETIDYKTGQWIYAFLACAHQPLLSDTCDTIRKISLRCAELRSHLNPDDENVLEAVSPLNIFICIVSRYFSQSDLCD